MSTNKFQILMLFSTRVIQDNTIGSKNFVPPWILSWLIKNYKKDAIHVKPYGVFVLDSIMHYSSDDNSQELIGTATNVRDIFGTIVLTFNIIIVCS